jgi:hypothetical protein
MGISLVLSWRAVGNTGKPFEAQEKRNNIMYLTVQSVHSTLPDTRSFGLELEPDQSIPSCSADNSLPDEIRPELLHSSINSLF